MNTLLKLYESAEALASTLDKASGGEHHYSKEIRRFLERNRTTHSEVIIKFKMMIDHDDGLLNSIDNEIVQLCYASDNPKYEHARIQQCIELIAAKTKFIKQLFLLPNTSLTGIDYV